MQTQTKIVLATQALIPDLVLGMPVAVGVGFKTYIGIFAGYSKSGTIRVEYFSDGGYYKMKYILRHHSRRLAPAALDLLPITVQNTIAPLIHKYNPLWNSQQKEKTS